MVLVLIFRKNRMVRLTLAIILLMSSNLASAATFNLEDHGAFTRDLNSNLEWLDLSFTQGKSYNQVLTELSSTPQLSGWRFATVNEFTGLFSSRGYAFSGATITTQNTGDQFNAALFPTLIEFFGATAVTGTGSIARGVLDENWVNGSNNSQIFGEIRFRNSIPTISSANLDKVLDNDSGSILGSFLVREVAVSPVPEPATWMMMLLGGIFLRFSARKKT